VPRATHRSGPVNEQLFGLARRVLTGHGVPPGSRKKSGEDPGKHPGVPRCQPAAVPRSRTIVLHSPLGSPDLQKEELLLRVRAAHPSSPMTLKIPKLHTQRPAGIISRTILRVIPDPSELQPEVRSRTPNIPNIFRWAGGCPTPPSNPAIPLGFRYLLLLGFVRLLWEFLLV
jgi:hypothetical protein